MSEASSDSSVSKGSPTDQKSSTVNAHSTSGSDQNARSVPALDWTDSVDQACTNIDQSNLVAHNFPFEFGDYRLIRKIGEGGMGIVYAAEQKSLGNRLLAVKIIKHSGVLNERALKRFQNEVQAVAQLEHRHIVPVYQFGEESGIHFYSMKLIDGNNLRTLFKTLQSAVSRRRRSTVLPLNTEQATSEHVDSTHRSGWSRGDTLASNDVIDRISIEGTTAHPQFVKEFVRMGIQIATALHHVHQQGVVHRDIKPANLLLDVNGDAWLSDFGLAMIRDNPSLTDPGDLVGTYQYMSPEQAMGSKRVIIDHRTDIYSLGVTLYELLTLERAFPGNSREEILRCVQFENPRSVRDIAPRVPRDLETIVMKAMSKDPAMRFQSAAELAAELRRFQDGSPLTIRPPSLIEKFGYWSRNNRHAIASIATVLAVTFLAAIIIAVVSIQSHAATKEALLSEKAGREKVTQLLERSEGLRLAANSSLQLENEPTIALLLATKAAEHHPGSETNNAIVRAMDAGRELRVLTGHRAEVGHVSFNADGTKLVSSASRRVVGKTNEPAILWDSKSGEMLGKLQDNQAITSCVFSPDNYRLLAVSSPLNLKTTSDADDPPPANPPSLWDGTTFQKLVTFENAFSFQAHPHAFSPKGRLIVLPTRDNSASTYDCVAGGEVVKFSGHEGPVYFAAFNPQGNQIVTASDDNTVRIWNAATGKQIIELDHWRIENAAQQPRDLRWVSFSPDGRRLATGSTSSGIELWDLENNGEKISTETLPGTTGLFFGNGDLLATHAAYEATLDLRNAYDGRLIETLRPANGMVRFSVASQDSQTIATLDGSDLRTVSLWDTTRGELRATLRGHDGRVNDLAISPNSKWIASASDDKTVRIWHLNDGRERSTYPSATWVAHSTVCCSPDGNNIVIVDQSASPRSSMIDFEQSNRVGEFPGTLWMPKPSGDRVLLTSEGQLAIHHLIDGKFTGLRAERHRRIDEAAINSKGDRVAASDDRGEILIWFPDQDRRFTLPVENTKVNKLRFDPNGTHLFAVSDDGTIRIWDTDSRQLLRSIQNGGRVLDLVFSPDSQSFAVVSNQDQATIYDAVSFEETYKLSEPETYFDRIAFSFDGKRLVSFNEHHSKSVQLWDLETGKFKAKLDVEGNVRVALDPSKPEALVCSDQDGVAIWRYEVNERLPVSEDPLARGTYSPDGKHFIVGTAVPIVTQVGNPETSTIQTKPAVVQRWAREGLLREQTILFPAVTIDEILVSDTDQVFVNTYRRFQIANYDVNSRQRKSTMAGHAGPITACRFTSDSKRLITASWDEQLSIWNVSDGTLLSRKNAHKSPILSAALSADDKRLATASKDGTCVIWNLANGATSAPIQLADSPIMHVELDQNAENVLAISADHRVLIARVESGEIVELDLHAEKIEWAEFAPDGTSILVIPQGSRDESQSDAVLIVPMDGSAVTRIEFDSPVVTSHFHPDSQRMVTATRNGRVVLQSVRSGKVEQEFRHEAKSISVAVLDQDGGFLFVGGPGIGTIWRTEDGLKWMTVEDRMSGQSRHTYNPFLPGQGLLPGQSRRFMTRRTDTLQYRDWPVQPAVAAKDQITRPLTPSEAEQFLLED